MSDKIVVMPEKEKDNAKAANASLRRQLPELIEYSKLLAKVRKEAFDAYVAEGFTPEQALELCKKAPL